MKRGCGCLAVVTVLLFGLIFTVVGIVPRVPVQLSDGVVWFKRKMRSGLQLEDRLRRRYKGYKGP